MQQLRIGTSSFSEKSWVGPFYPTGTKAADYLSYYATVFDTVEVDSTYYAIPSRTTVEGWARKTPERFTLAAKFPRSIVHGGASERPDPARVIEWSAVGADTLRFLELCELLGPRRGPLLLQFPYFNQQAFKSAAPFVERLDAFLAHLPSGPRYAVELRNKHWIGAPLLDVLRRHRTALALSDLVYMPHPLELWHAHGPALLTADFAYGRLIGDRKAIDALTASFDRIVVDQEPRLAQWVELLRELSARNFDTFVYVNNHYAGHGPATVRRLQELLTEAAHLIPLRDSEPVDRVPWVTWLLIVANVLVFAHAWQLTEPELEAFVARYAVHPAWYAEAGPTGLLEFPRQLALPLVTSLFLHGGIAHLLGNLWMLWIFGDNVEDRLGALRYLLFYAACGVLANGVHILSSPDSAVPTIGASGAIAGVMGAYFVSFPRAKVLVFTLLVVFPYWFEIPALLFLALWFLLQFAQGSLAGSIEGDAGGIAWWAHVGGFLGGIALLWLLGGRRRPRGATRQPSV